MNRNEFEAACLAQNVARKEEVARNREERVKACDVEVMMAFGGTPYCRTHRVMGECPFGPESK